MNSENEQKPEIKETKALKPAAPASEQKPGTGEFDLEAKFFDFLKENGQTLVWAVAVAAVVIVGVQIGRVVMESHEQSVRATFGEARDAPAWLDFAAGHPKHSLTGLAYLQAAHAQYVKQDYQQAAGNYKKALELLPAGYPFIDRAKIGRSMSLYMGGDKPAGIEALKALTADTTLLEAARAEAHYLLATHYWEAGDIAAAKEEIKRIDELENPGTLWKMRASKLTESMAEMGNAEKPAKKEG